MVAINYFNSFFDDVMEGKHTFASDTLKVALTNTLPVATNSVFTDITEIAAGNGYTAGGQALDNVTSTQTAGVYSLGADNEVFTASGGSMATFRYVVLYNGTEANDALICWWDHGTAVTLASGGTFTIAFTGGVVFNYRVASS